MNTETLKAILSLIFIVILAGCAGDTRVGETSVAGAAIGAGVGLLVGSLQGKLDEGHANGMALGASEGANAELKHQQDDVGTKELINPIRGNQPSDASLNTSSRDREELTRFLGAWSIEGWTIDREHHYDVHAKAKGSIQMGSYVLLSFSDVHIKDQNIKIRGAALFGYDRDDGYSYTSSINNQSKTFIIKGQYDTAMHAFTFISQDDRMVVKFDTLDSFTLETFHGRKKIESYRFTKH